MPSLFTPVQVVDPEKERDWPYKIGLLDWDDTKIVFTKRTLLEFLRYTGTSVDTNMSNIAKLPRYVEFGTISEAPAVTASVETPATDVVSSAVAASEPETAPAPAADDFIPTRRVREAPGGKQLLQLFEDEFPNDALAAAPNQSAGEAPTGVSAEPSAQNEWGAIRTSNIPGFKPTRRVRDAPGGKSEIGTSLFG